MADIAYHRDKLSRGYDEIIDIWGPDHHGYIARLAGAMKAMGSSDDKFKVLIAQQVNLVMEGETVKMSKRLGRFSTMRELLDEIGVDVARYFFIMRSMESHLDFDIALAKKAVLKIRYSISSMHMQEFVHFLKKLRKEIFLIQGK